ncbi:MAG: hypothetical protein EA378_03345 [Phycisphaerales bacterium]|nr:MAG: hypothetical protein EA378_03345 [Phycisphaerales bacterium]
MLTPPPPKPGQRKTRADRINEAYFGPPLLRRNEKWLWLAMLVIGLVCVVLLIWVPMPNWATKIMSYLFFIPAFAFAAIVSSGIKRRLRRGEVPCPNCGFDLQGLHNTEFCPECGHHFESPEAARKAIENYK